MRRVGSSNLTLNHSVAEPDGDQVSATDRFQPILTMVIWLQEHLFWSNVVPFVSQVATKWRRETSSTFSVVWSLLGLLLLAVVALVVLTAALVYQMRSRRYPERGVISLQRPRTVL